MRDLAGAASPRGAGGRLQAAAIVLLCVFLFVLPFRSSVALRNVALWGAVLLLAFPAWRAGTLRSLAPPRRLLLPVLLLAGWCVLSVAWSVDRGASAMELRPEVLTPLAAFLAFHAATRRFEDLDRWAVAIAAGLAALAALAFAQQAIEGDWNPREWHVDVGYYSTHAALALPMLAWAWLRTRSRLAHALLAATALGTLVVVYWTDNRIVWPTLAVMAAGAALLATPGTQARDRRRLAWLAALAIAAAAVVFAAAHRERHATLVRMDPRASADFATDPRWRIWPQGVERWREAPWLGRGFGRPTLALPAGTPPDGMQDPRVWHAHNVFLDVALELGVVGLALFLATIVAFAREALAALASAAPRRWVAIMALATLVAFVMKNFPDDFFVRHIALFCAALAGVFAGALQQHAEPAEGTIVGPGLAETLPVTSETRAR